MIGRVRQFLTAVTARMTPAYRDLVNHWLTPAERELFYAMDEIDQVHACRVALTAAELASNLPPADVNRTFLMKCALLHDVGRVRGDLGLWGKVFAVLMAKYLPEQAKRIMKPVVRSWRDVPGHVMYVYRHHPAIGAAKLRHLGYTREADVVERHHERPQAGDPVELTLVREADGRN